MARTQVLTPFTPDPLPYGRLFKWPSLRFAYTSFWASYAPGCGLLTGSKGGVNIQLDFKKWNKILMTAWSSHVIFSFVKYVKWKFNQFGKHIGNKHFIKINSLYKTVTSVCSCPHNKITPWTTHQCHLSLDLSIILMISSKSWPLNNPPSGPAQEFVILPWY